MPTCRLNQSPPGFSLSQAQSHILGCQMHQPGGEPLLVVFSNREHVMHLSWCLDAGVCAACVSLPLVSFSFMIFTSLSLPIIPEALIMYLFSCLGCRDFFLHFLFFSPPVASLGTGACSDSGSWGQESALWIGGSCHACAVWGSLLQQPSLLWWLGLHMRSANGPMSSHLGYEQQACQFGGQLFLQQEVLGHCVHQLAQHVYKKWKQT